MSRIHIAPDTPESRWSCGMIKHSSNERAMPLKHLSSHLLILFLFFAAHLSAQVVFVDVNAVGAENGTSWPDAFTSLQQAIDAAAAHTEIWVSKGTYFEQITLKNDVGLFGGFEGTELSLAERDFKNNLTIIDGEALAVVISAQNLGRSAVLDGFVITNGKGTIITGSGINLDLSAATIRNNIIRENDGIGIWHRGFEVALIEHNLILNNTGIGFSNNTSSAIFRNNTVIGNEEGVRSVQSFFGGNPKISNCIFWENGDDLTFISRATYSDIEDGDQGLGNISSDPLFIDAENEDYHLSKNSPCVDSGDPASPLDPDGTRADMGAYYFDQRGLPSPQQLTAVRNSQSIQLSWAVPSDIPAEVMLAAYNIYRSDSSGVLPNEQNLLASLGAEALTYEDADVIRGKVYYYVVTARYDQGESNRSTEVSLSLAEFIAPSDLVIQDGSLAGEVFLRWKKPVFPLGEIPYYLQTFRGYNVYRSTAANVELIEENLIATRDNLEDTNLIDNSVSTGTAFFYVLTANYDDGESMASNEVSIIPNDPPLAPDISLSTSDVDFGTIDAWSTISSPMTIENVGARSLIINQMLLLDGTASFDIDPVLTFPIVLDPGDSSLQFEIRFKPTTIGEKTAELIVYTNDLDEEELKIRIKGHAIAPPSANQPTMRLYLVGEEKRLSEIPAYGFPGFGQNIDAEDSIATFGPFILKSDMQGNDYHLNLWAISPFEQGGQGQTTTNYIVETIISNEVGSHFAFTADKHEISSGTKLSQTAIDRETQSGDSLWLRVKYDGGFGGRISWELDGLGASYIEVPAAPYNVVKINELQLSEDRLNSIILDQELAYVAADENFYVLDISNPFAISILGSLPLSGRAIALSDHTAYVVANGSLHLIDITTPSEPFLISSFDGLSTIAQGLSISGNYAYIADGFQGLKVIDVSNLAEPELTGSYDTPGSAGGVQISGNFAYVADGSSGLQVVDISDPFNLLLVGHFDTPGSAQQVVVEEDHVFVADRQGGLQVIDIANPEDPMLLSIHESPSRSEALSISGDHLAIARSGGTVDFVDISDPAQTSLAGRGYGFSFLEDIAVCGNTAYVLENFGQMLRIYQFQPEGPQPILAISSQEIDFGEVDLEVQKDTTISIRNVGTADLVLNDVFIKVPSSPFQLQMPHEFPITLSPNTGVDLKVGFLPLETGVFRDTLVIRSPDLLNEEYSLPLSGTGELIVANSARNKASLSLQQNFPNPFSSHTMINYSLAKATSIQMTISDVLGRELNILLNEHQQAGNYQVIWNGLDANGNRLPSGTYYFTLQSEEANQTLQLLLLR